MAAAPAEFDVLLASFGFTHASLSAKERIIKRKTLTDKLWHKFKEMENKGLAWVVANENGTERVFYAASTDTWLLPSWSGKLVKEEKPVSKKIEGNASDEGAGKEEAVNFDEGNDYEENQRNNEHAHHHKEIQAKKHIPDDDSPEILAVESPKLKKISLPTQKKIVNAMWELERKDGGFPEYAMEKNLNKYYVADQDGGKN
jgi:hypothetical protein